LVTEHSTPVGFGRVFMYFSSNHRANVLPSSDLPPTTLFRNGLLLPTLHTQTEWMALTACFSLFIIAQIPSIASKAQRVEPDTPCTGWEKLSRPTPSQCERDATRRLPRGASRSVERVNNQPGQAARAYFGYGRPHEDALDSAKKEINRQLRLAPPASPLSRLI